MSGRYAFSLPDPQPRDGWFRVGTVDVTTTVLVTALGAVSMVLYAIDPQIVANGVFVPELVREGEIWRLLLWPLVNLPGFWELLGLVVFWYFGRFVEDEIGKVPQAVLLAAMAVVPALVVTLVNVANNPPLDVLTRWTTSSFSLNLFGLAMLCVFCADKPNAPFFFNIPAWVVALVLVALDVLQILAVRGWADLVLLAVVVCVGIFGAHQRGVASELTFIPRFGFLTGGPPSPYGQPATTRQPRKRRGGHRKGRSGHASSAGPATGTVVTGPWSGPSGGATPLEHAELDSLLDIIAEKGIDALTPQERRRLDELRQRLRDS